MFAIIYSLISPHIAKRINDDGYFCGTAYILYVAMDRCPSAKHLATVGECLPLSSRLQHFAGGCLARIRIEAKFTAIDVKTYIIWRIE